VHRAFCDDGGTPVVLTVDGTTVTYESDLPAARVAAHAARIVSADHDGAAFAEVARRDPVVADLQRRFPGVRPTCFGTPFEAACWAVLSQRTSMRQAQGVKDRLTAALGPEVGGTHCFPAPATIAEASELPGLIPVKAGRLRGIAAAAAAGDLDADRLRTADPDEALEQLKALPGIGPFSAMLILIRGAGHPDANPTAEARIPDAVERAYGRRPDDRALQAIAEAWRPYRSWVVYLLRRALDAER
jgi:DNA-3-methyladenine glycosylase II